MKITKRLITVITVLAVTASLLPAALTASAEEKTVLFTEDFESYEVGTIVEASADQSSSTRIGNIDYQLRAGDKLEIALENGNKYLKITRASTSSTNSHIKYYFPDTYSNGKYFISYDFKPEVHNRHFARFGSFIRSDGSVNLTTVSYGKNVYANSSTGSTAYYIGNLINTANYTGTAYATVTQEIDLTNSSDNYKFTAVYPGSSGTVTKTVTNTANQLGITGLAWAIKKHDSAGYNGPDDASAAAVYRIDNIVVETTAGLELSSVNVDNNGIINETTPFTMTFKEAVSSASVSISKNGTAMSSSDYNVTISGSTVSVIPLGGWEDGAEYTLSVGTVTAVSGCAPYEGETYTVTGSRYLFVEDFEDWTVGTLASSAADTSADTSILGGIIDHRLQNGDKIEIAQEENGNKYFKITRASTTGSGNPLRIKYNFTNGYSDKKYAVSYDFMSEEHNQYFDQFGSLLGINSSGTRSGVNRKIISYNKNVYFNNDPSKNAHSGILDPAYYTALDYATITQTIDFTNLNSTKYTTNRPDGTGGFHTATSTNNADTSKVGFCGLHWSLYVNSTASYNGSTDHSKPSVYRIDNIKVEAIPQKYVNATVGDNETGVSANAAVTLNFSEPVGASNSITVTRDGAALTKNTDYTVSVSENTIMVTPVNGWGEGSSITISGTVSGANTLTDYEGRMLTFETEAYDETVPPDIVSSSIANGAQNVDYRTASLVLSTDGVMLNSSSVTKQNIKLYKNGAPIDSYSVALQGDCSVLMTFAGLEKDKSYTVTVSGLTSRGDDPLTMTRNFVLDFETVGDIYADNISLSKTESANVYDFSATVNNKTVQSQSYQPVIAVQNKADGRLLDVKLAPGGVLAANGSADISVSGINVNLDNADCTLYLWKNLAGLEPLAGKKTVKSMKIGKTVIFANNSKVAVVDGVPVEEETGVQKGAGGFVIPASLSSKYFNINSSLSESDLTQRGIGYYVSPTYDFIAVGDNVAFDAGSEQTAIKKFGIYVSPTGSDSNEGLCSAPVKTLARAIKLYENDNKQPIYVHAGKYRQSEALILNSSKDTGLVIKAFGDGEVAVSGAVELPSGEFTAVTDQTVLNKIPSGARAYVKQISLDDYVDGAMSKYREYTTQQISDSYYELFSGDEAQTLARWPNEGFSTISGVSGNTFTVSSSKASLWKSADNGIIAGYFKHNWAFEDIYIDKTAGGSSVIALASAPKYGIESGNRFYAMNMLEELDSAGEYYIDTDAKILYYYPTADFSTVNPELSVTDKTEISANYSKNCLMYILNVSNITISGITFEKTRGSGIVTSGGSNISVDGCVLRNIGNTAVSLSSANSEVVNSHIYSIGGRGITAEAGSNNSLTDGNITISDNTIHDFGRVFRTYQGAIHLSGCGNTAEYNTIYDAPHCAIRFSGSKHKIKHNIIHDVVKETSDSGAIYAGRDWTSWGTAISSNYFYNINNNVSDGHTKQAVYIDDLMCGTTVSNNVFKDCDCAAFFGGGRGNTFKNNIVVNCGTGLRYDNRGESWSAGQLQRGQTSSGDDTILETFVKFLENSSVAATMDERNGFNGFTLLVNDVNNSSDKLGYPKSAVITGNNFYGSRVNNSGYLNLHEHVTNYGTYSSNNKSTTVPEYDIPACGARN